MKIYTKRHSRWYEKLLLSFFFQFFLGSSAVFISCYVYNAFNFNFISEREFSGFNSLIAVISAFGVTLVSLRNLFRFPGSQSSAYVVPITTIVFSIMVIIILISRVLYSNFVIITGFSITLFWCYIGFFIGNRYRLRRYAVVPIGEALQLKGSQGIEFVFLEKPDLGMLRFNGVIADLQSKDLGAEWEKFLAKCTLSSIPVYHTRQVNESITGRVKINRLSENEFGALLPSSAYSIGKRILDISISFTLIPILLLPFSCLAILIKLESRGPVFFKQKRVGFRANDFIMVKFRSMYIDKTGLGFTSDSSDPRITKIGRIIRKYRIDELPQIFNVLLGDMSLIGPRPESAELAEWYERDVPFFSYRHVVRPGITGWAQVNQGYAAEVEGMNEKLEYDFYYIKHFSFWLDVLIIFKTFKTISTGFGSR